MTFSKGYDAISTYNCGAFTFRLSRATRRLKVNTQNEITCTYWLIMDRSILRCTLPSIQHFLAITNETRENINIKEIIIFHIYSFLLCITYITVWQYQLHVFLQSIVFKIVIYDKIWASSSQGGLSGRYISCCYLCYNGSIVNTS